MFLYVLLRDLDFAADAAVEIEKKVKYVVFSCFPRWRGVQVADSRSLLTAS